MFEKNSGEGGSRIFAWKQVEKVSGSSVCRGLRLGRALLGSRWETLSALSDRGCFNILPPFGAAGARGCLKGVSGFWKREGLFRGSRRVESLPLPDADLSIRASVWSPLLSFVTPWPSCVVVPACGGSACACSAFIGEDAAGASGIVEETAVCVE